MKTLPAHVKGCIWAVWQHGTSEEVLIGEWEE